MFKRIQYSIFKNIRSFSFRTVILTVLLTFFIASLLISNLADVYDKIFIGNVDLTVEVSSEFSSTDYTMDTVAQYLDAEKKLEEQYHAWTENTGIAYSDMDITLNSLYPIIPSKIEGEGISFFSSNITNGAYSGSKNKFLTGATDLQSANLFSEIEAVNNAVPQNFEQGNLKLFGGRLFEQQEIDQGEMVCVIPFAAGGSWEDGKNTMYPPVGDDFTLTTYYINNNEIIDHLSWNLKIIGSYQNELSNDDWCIHGTASSIPVFIPYKTLAKMQSEAIAFQQKYNTDYLTKTRGYQWGSIDAMEFNFQDIDSLNQFVKDIESSESFKEGRINYLSMADAYGTILSNIYTMTDSFRMIAAAMLVLTITYSLMLVGLNAVYRRKEIAVLQSMGEKKSRINLQFFIEQMISLMISCAVSLPLSLFIAKKYGVYLFTSDMKNNDSTIAKAIWSSFLGKHMKLTAQEIEDMITYENMQLLIIAAAVLLIMLISFIMIKFMTDRFHARELLNGEE